MFDSKLVMQLRAQTGAGVLDAKKALEETNGDLAQAVDFLRKKGAVKAAAKAERVTKEGVIALAKQGSKIAVAQLACETDFVARNSDFINTAEEFAQKLLTVSKEEFKTWAEEKIKNELAVKIGENIQLGQFDVFTGEVLGSYLHSNKKVAAVVILSGGTQELANDLAMQAAAMSPKYVRPEDVPADEAAKEKEICREQLKGEGKPENILEKIVAGKLAKFYEEVCLFKQSYIKDEDLTIEKLIAREAAKTGQEIKVESFTRYSL
ncbi:MAG: translation elongation factor Ts [bacterium]|nr:translation elongation factor Ts [bacterium]